MNKRIISIIGPKGMPSSFRGTSGIEAYVEHQIKQLTKTNHIVHCYVRKWTKPTKTMSYKNVLVIPVLSINSKHLDAITYSLIASVRASLNDSTLVWYHGIGPAFFSWIPKLFRKTVYTTIHSLDWQRDKWGGVSKIFLRLSEFIALHFSTKIFVVSNSLKKYYKSRTNKPIIVSKYPLIKHKPIKADLITKKYGLKNNSYILYLGRFVPEKRIEWLINAFIKIKPNNLKLVLAGGSSHSDGYVNMIKCLVNKNTKQSKNIILTKYVFGQEKEELLSNSLLMVLPSKIEGYPVSVVEALGYEKTCLVGHYLKNEYSSSLVKYYKQDDFNSFLKKIKYLTS
ncbi:glycosyltransferase family 4 protein [Patescibacteria group bacterium]